MSKESFAVLPTKGERMADCMHQADINNPSVAVCLLLKRGAYGLQRYPPGNTQLRLKQKPALPVDSPLAMRRRGPELHTHTHIMLFGGLACIGLCA